MKWWKQKQSEFWRYKKLTGPQADEYNCKENAHVKRVLSRKKGLEDEDNSDNADDGDDISLLDADEEDPDTGDVQVKQEKVKNKVESGKLLIGKLCKYIHLIYKSFFMYVYLFICVLLYLCTFLSF